MSQGVVLHAGKSFQARFGELAGRASKLDVPKNVALKKPADYKLVGKPIKRDDVRTKVFADFTFMQDVKVDGMVHARVIHPDAYGAQLETVDDTHAKKVPGFLRTVHVGNLLAVIANDEWAATRSARANALNSASILWWLDRPYTTFTCTLARAADANPSKKSCTSSVCRSPTRRVFTFRSTTAYGRPLRSTAATARVTIITESGSETSFTIPAARPAFVSPARKRSAKAKRPLCRWWSARRP